MKKVIFLFAFFALACFAGLNAQSLTIKIPKSYQGATNEKIWVIPVGQVSTGPDAVKMMVSPTDDGTNWVYTMTSASNINKINNFLNANANNRYRIYYHSANIAAVTNTSSAQVGNFRKNCREGGIIVPAPVGKSCTN